MEQVVRVHRVYPDGQADIIHFRESACSGDCHHCSGCGAARETMIVRAENPIGAAEGSLVTVRSDTSGVLKAAAAVYMMPVVLFFLGYSLGTIWNIGGLLGCGGFLAGLSFAVWLDRRQKKHNRTVYTIIGFAPEEGQAER